MDTIQPLNNKDSRDGRHLSPAATVALIIGIFLLLTAGFWLVTDEEWLGRDFTRFFGSAAQVALTGKSPYLYNPNWPYPTATPPWIIPIALPFSFLPDRLARAAWLAASLLTCGYVLRKLEAPPLGAALFLLSPMMLLSFMTGQVEWLVFLGLVVPRPIGLILLMLKPQMGALLALYWAIEAWRDDGIMAVIRLVAPFAGVLLLSFALYGFWPEGLQRFTTAEYRSSLWPYGFPIAVAALITAIRRREEAWAGAAGPLIAPYVKLHSWSMPLIWLVRDPVMLGAVCLASWALTVLNPLTLR